MSVASRGWIHPRGSTWILALFITAWDPRYKGVHSHFKKPPPLLVYKIPDTTITMAKSHDKKKKKNKGISNTVIAPLEDDLPEQPTDLVIPELEEYAQVAEW